jgi:hypothetical protein
MQAMPGTKQPSIAHPSIAVIGHGSGRSQIDSTATCSHKFGPVVSGGSPPEELELVTSGGSPLEELELVTSGGSSPDELDELDELSAPSVTPVVCSPLAELSAPVEPSGPSLSAGQPDSARSTLNTAIPADVRRR